jgi:hypothetical protein
VSHLYALSGIQVSIACAPNRPIGAVQTSGASSNLSLVVERKYADSGLDKEQFAKVIGVSLPQLYLMLWGDSKPSLLTVIDIAKRLGVGMWELLEVSTE